MSKPEIAVKEAAILELEVGTYYWCSCGRSKSQPFCDGSHKGSEFEPVMFEVTRKKRQALCQCKRTSTPPFCDDSHNEL